MNSKFKGDIAAIECIRYFTNKGNQVLVPIGDRQKYDLVIDDGTKLFKVQCKFTSQKMRYGPYAIKLYVGGGNRSSGNVKTSYKTGDFDVIFAMTEYGDLFIIPIEECLKRKAMIVLSDVFRVNFSLADCKPAVSKQNESKTNGAIPC